MASTPHKQLRDYLERYRTNSTEWNLTGFGGDDKGKYFVPAKDYERFLQIVHDTIFGKPSHACSLLERHLTCGPILIDLDFKYSAGAHLQRRFTAAQIRDFVVSYASALYRFMDLSSLGGKKLRFFVMLKPGPEADKNASKHKDGVHIVCPDLTLDPKIQYTLRGIMLNKGCVQAAFDDTGFVNPEQDVFDVSVINRNNWFLYGATKPDKNWYKVETIYEVPTTLEVLNMGEEARFSTIEESMDEEDPDDYETFELMKLLSIRIGHEQPHSLKVDEDRKFEWESYYEKWSSGKVGGQATRNQISTPTQDHGEGAEPAQLSLDNQANEQPVFEEPVVGYTSDDIQQASDLLEKCLNPIKRAKDYGSWIDLGLCLFNIDPEEKMMNRWATFSRRVDGYEATPTETYAKVWRGFQNTTASRKIRMGTLHFWAMEDNNHKYKEITEKTCVGWILGNVDATHVKVATLMKLLYQYEFRCTMTGRKMLDYFQYTGNYWKKLKSPNELRARLANRIVYMYLLAAREVTRLEMVARGDGEKLNVDAEVTTKTTALREKGKNINKTVTCLEGAPFKNHVMTECNEKFYDETFTDNLNQRKDIFACGNCVVELRHYASSDVKAGDVPHVYVRKGRPDDYISFAMGKEKDIDPITLDYDPKTGLLLPFDPTTPEQMLLSDFFSKIFPDEDLRHYVLTLLSACLEGENREQKFYIMTGGGGNGKSVLINLMRFVFGEYQTSLNTAALTRRRPESGAANPDIIGLQAKRFIYMQEPDEGEKLNTARIKQFTGNDIVEARGLFADQEKFKIMGRIFFSTNDLPPVNSMDGGTWRRIEVLPFKAAFKPKGHPEIDPANNVYEMDINLEDKFKQNPVRAAFLRLLLHHWETVYLKDGLSYPPECVLEAINRYKSDNDSFVAFAKDTLVKEHGAEASLSDIVVNYKRWNNAQPPGRKILKKQELVERLLKMYKSSDGGKTYRDIRVAMEGEDISGNYVE
jgi:P4 family phage/plasmid primase-like protien